MNRPYLVLWFAAALFLVLIGWGLYGKWTEPPPSSPATQPTTQPLVERLRAERERRLRERGEMPATTRSASAPSSS